MCHVRRRDNLTFSLHMLVETVFWFHPLVWWIRRQLIEEREHACDESVLLNGNEAEVYAESILNVCKYYVESPLACVSGVTGSDLKKRIVRIMTEQVSRNLDFSRKMLLGLAVVVAVSVPVVFGLMHETQIHAQTQAKAAVDISGTWQGTLQAGSGLRTVLKISKTDSGW
jgi:beta-lactamase regulating signal transducer with metallopeptidase domain